MPFVDLRLQNKIRVYLLERFNLEPEQVLYILKFGVGESVYFDCSDVIRELKHIIKELGET